MNVLVVGGGIAGLVAAHELQRSGHTVRVLEREAVAGGRMRSEAVGEFVVDRGAQFISSAYRNMRELARELGIAERIHALRRTDNAMVRHGRLWPGAYDSAARLLASGYLSLGAKLRLPLLLPVLWRHWKTLDPMRPESAAHLDDEDAATFLRRLVGDEAFEYVFQPAFSGTFDSEPESLSKAFVLTTLRFFFSGFRLLAFEGGNGLLTRTLAARLPVDTRATVLEVRSDAGGVRAVVATAAGEREERADAAVLALPGSLVGGLCPTLTPEERAFFDQVRYCRGIIVFFLMQRLPPFDCYGIGLPRRECPDIYGLAVDHHKEGAAPPGRGLLNCALSEAAAARWFDEPDDAVVRFALDTLARTPVGSLEPLAGAQVHRWDPMLPQFHRGYVRALAAFLRRRRRSPHLAFCGDYLVGPYTEAALTSGRRAAEELSGLPTTQD
jgi:oxygen-dependent protoporphyrinogen oxidase